MHGDFLTSITPCPDLPAVVSPLRADVTRCLGEDRGPLFYVAALRYAQSLWREGKPAQAILQLNKAWMADLPPDDPILQEWPAPYRALSWMLKHGQELGFIGNPVRHFQHLATRVNGPRREVRQWRAWACFHLAEKVLADAERYPRDFPQSEREGLTFPYLGQTRNSLYIHGWSGEDSVWLDVYSNC